MRVDADVLDRPSAETLAEMDHCLLDGRGLLRLLPVDAYARWKRSDVRVWCMLRGRYFLPTFEFVAWLRGVIGGAYALEVGAGRGDLCHHLGIQGSDSYVQETPPMLAYYEALGQATTRPGRHVVKLEALAAIRRYVPRVVVGAWCTQVFQEGDTERGIGSSLYGFDEHAILAAMRPGSRYIAIGNLRVHGDRRILSLPHEVHCPPGLLSRASSPLLERVWIWTVGEAPRRASERPSEVHP